MVTKKSLLTSVQSLSMSRRGLISALLAGIGFSVMRRGVAKSAETANSEDELRFPGEAEHKVVYQFNKASEDYHKAVLFSVGAMVRKYGDNIQVVVVAIGPGLHILAQKPQRPVSKDTRQRVDSLSQYGVEFHACGNTMKALKWTEKDLLPLAKVVEVGAADLMELQEAGYAYLSW